MQNDLLPVLAHYGVVLLITIVIEEAIAVFFFGKKWVGYVLVLLVNVVTNPAINILYAWLNTFTEVPPFGAAVILMEMAVVWAEYRLISHGMNNRSTRWLVFSLTANTASYLTGLLAA